MAYLFAYIFPFAAAVILYFWFRHKTTWFEFLAPVAASTIFIFGFKGCSEYVQTQDTEYWGGTLVKAEYYEEWSEWIHQTCTCCCDEDGNNCTTYDCSYEQVHSPYWQVVSSTGESVKVSRSEFNRLVKKFGNKVEVELNRNSCCGNDGDKWVTKWQGERDLHECVVTMHTYENRVQASNSVFNYPEVVEEDKKRYQLYDYPNIYDDYKQRCILGKGDGSQKQAEKDLQYLNATLGGKKQVKVFILLFEDQPLQAGKKQEAYWKNGNKNELVITIGVDKDKNVNWCHVFSWTEVQEVKIEVRNYVSTMDKLNLQKIVAFTHNEIETKWNRKEFADFAYLEIPMTTGQLLWLFILTIVVNCIVSYFMVVNDIEPEVTYRRKNTNQYFASIKRRFNSIDWKRLKFWER